MEAKNPYPKIITDESSGIEVANNDHFVWEDGFKAGMEEVVEEARYLLGEAPQGEVYSAWELIEKLEAKLKEWGF